MLNINMQPCYGLKQFITNVILFSSGFYFYFFHESILLYQRKYRQGSKELYQSCH